MEKRLYKSNKNNMIDGVCAGIAEYFNIDPTLVPRCRGAYLRWWQRCSGLYHLCNHRSP